MSHTVESAQVANSHLVCDPTIRQPGFDLPRQQWSLLNRFRTKQGHCGACRRKWRFTDTDLCPCGETQTMSHIVESAQVVNSHLVVTPQSGNQVSTSLSNSGLCWTVFARNREECIRDKPPFSFVRGQDSTMWDIVWVSPQGHRSVSVSRHILLQASQCPCSVWKWLSSDQCCRGRSKPGCRIVGSHTCENWPPEPTSSYVSIDFWWFNTTVNKLCKYLQTLHDFTITFYVIFHDVRGLETVLVNSMTFRNWYIFHQLFIALSMIRCSKSAQTSAFSGASSRYCCYENHAAGSKPI